MWKSGREWILAALLVYGSAAWSQVGIQDHRDRLAVRNGRVTMVLSKVHKGAIVSLADNATRQEFAATQTDPALFRLVFTKKGDVSGATQAFSSRDAGRVTYSVKSTADGETAVLRFSSIGGRSIGASCAVSVRKGDSLVRWRLSVTGADPLVLEEVQFPIVVLNDSLGEVRDDDVALAGATEDGRYLAPGNWRIGHRRVYTQPGSLCAQFGCYYDSTAGFYTATQDGKGYPKRLAIARVPDGMSFAWSHLCHHEAQKPFELAYDVVCTTFRGKDKTTPPDWRDAADIHKQWALGQPWCARTVAQRKDIPEWIKRGCIRLQWELRHDGDPGAAADWLGRYWNKHFAPLPPLATFFGFERVGDWVSPKYFPFYPSDEAFQDAARRIRKMGGHVFLFPSTYQWTLTYDRRADGSLGWDDRADFEKRGRPHAVLRRDGSTLTTGHSWLRGGESAALCRGDAWARGFIGDIVVQLVERGVDVVQMDQVVGGRWPPGNDTPCFSRHHGHPPGYGLWDVEAFHAQMKALRQRCDKVKPQVVFSEESPQELFAQDFGLFDYRHARANVNVKIWDLSPRKHAPVFPYLYNEFVPVFHIPSHSEPVSIILAHAIVSGEIPSFKRRQIKFPGDPVLEDGGFESWANGPVGWKIWRSDPTGAAKVCQDDEDRRAGQCSLRLDGEQEGETVQVYQCIPVGGAALSVGGTYRVRLRLKSRGLEGTGGLSAEALDSPDWRAWKRLGSWTGATPADTNWTADEIALTVPQGSQILRLMLSLNGKGKVWFDDLTLEQVRDDGTARELVWPGNPVFKMLHQWARLVADGAGKYLLLGRMLHPPRLQTGKTRYTLAASKASVLKSALYTMNRDQSGTVEYTSCPLSIARGEGPWEHKSLELTVGPGAAAFHIPMSLRQKGELLFDDLVLTEAGRTENLMHNGGFENWPDASAPPPGWRHIEEYKGRTFTGRFCREEKDTHTGAFAIRLVNETDGDAVHVKQVLPVDGKTLSVGKTYRVSFWVKVGNVARWRPVRVEREHAVILHNAFRAPDGSEAVIAVNITDQPQTGRLGWGGREIELALAPWELRLVTR